MADLLLTIQYQNLDDLRQLSKQKLILMCPSVQRSLCQQKAPLACVSKKKNLFAEIKPGSFDKRSGLKISHI